MDGEGLPLNDRGIDCLLFLDLLIVREQNLGRIGL